jgi:transcriptional regulator with PAS, ATPase and Fis domain
MAFDWPGNVRQLENVMERSLALAPGRAQLSAADLPEEIRQAPVPVPASDLVIPDEGVNLDGLVSVYEHTLIRHALARTGGNKRQAADLLRIKRTTLIEKLKRLER